MPTTNPAGKSSFWSFFGFGHKKTETSENIQRQSSHVAIVVTGQETSVAGTVNTDNMHPQPQVAAQAQATSSRVSRFVQYVKSFFSSPPSGEPKTSFCESLKHTFTFWTSSSARKQVNMETFVSYLTNTVLKEEGIFRVPGTKTTIDTITKDLEKRVVLDEKGYATNDVASAFKEFIGTCQIFETKDGKNLLWEACKDKDPNDASFEVAIKGAVAKLSPEKKKLLLSLVTLLKAIAAESSTNKMDVFNLGVVIGPRLIPLTDKDRIEKTATINKAAEILINMDLSILS